MDFLQKETLFNPSKKKKISTPWLGRSFSFIRFYCPSFSQISLNNNILVPILSARLAFFFFFFWLMMMIINRSIISSVTRFIYNIPPIIDPLSVLGLHPQSLTHLFFFFSVSKKTFLPSPRLLSFINDPPGGKSYIHTYILRSDDSNPFFSVSNFSPSRLYNPFLWFGFCSVRPVRTLSFHWSSSSPTPLPPLPLLFFFFSSEKRERIIHHHHHLSSA